MILIVCVCVQIMRVDEDDETVVLRLAINGQVSGVCTNGTLTYI